MKRYALDQKMKRMFTAAFLVVLLLAAGLFAGISGSMYRKQAYQFCVSQVELNLNILDSSCSKSRQSSASLRRIL